MSNNPPKKDNNYKWIIFGVIWGVIMVLLIGVFEPIYYDEPITWSSLRHDVFLWLPGGITLGFVMHLITNKDKKKA